VNLGPWPSPLHPPQTTYNAKDRCLRTGCYKELPSYIIPRLYGEATLGPWLSLHQCHMIGSAEF
jgi:hypothetical protein